MKILIGFIMDGHAGGVDKYLLTFADAVRSNEVQIDFLTNRKNQELEKQLEKNNSKLHEVANLKHPFLQYKQIMEILKTNKYDMTYFNISTAISIIGPYAAYRSGVKKRAIHSHSSGNDCECFWKRKILDAVHSLGKLFLYKYGNEYYGCSKAAGKWLFPESIVESEEFTIIYNAVDLKKFQFNKLVREQLRKKYKVEECLVIGHVGNFNYQKNHVFLIKIFNELVKVNPLAKLILIGNGVNCVRIKCMVEKLNLQDKVFFLGWRSDISDLYQMMDIFVLPSHFEGLPIVGVEAQATGLKCLFSDKITDEVKLTKEARFLPISNCSVSDWVKCIEKEKTYSREENISLDGWLEYDLEEQQKNYIAILKK
ncbi:glycosyltransferase [Blautia producta]|nr:glycosyltransferase [Blautia producta]